MRGAGSGCLENYLFLSRAPAPAHAPTTKPPSTAPGLDMDPQIPSFSSHSSHPSGVRSVNSFARRSLRLCVAMTLSSRWLRRRIRNARAVPGHVDSNKLRDACFRVIPRSFCLSVSYTSGAFVCDCHGDTEPSDLSPSLARHSARTLSCLAQLHGPPSTQH